MTATTQAPPSAPQPPKQRPKWYFSPWFWTVAMVGLFGLLAAAALVAAPPEATTTAKPTAVTEPVAPAVTDAEPAVTEPPAPTYPKAKAKDFTLKVKVLSKENFSSAGSLITYRIVADWAPTYDPDKTYEVVYEVRGGEDGPAINTMEVQGDEFRTEDEEVIYTASANQRLTARVTSVEDVS